jgi:chromate transport protein ChrA
MAPFLPAVAAIGWLTQRHYRRQFAIIFMAAALLPGCWAIRNLAMVEGPSSNSRAMTNLVQGSWPEYHSAWQAWSTGDADGRRTMKAIDAEIALAVHDRSAGLQAIEARISGQPLHYFTWYITKPALLWDWSYRIAAGHIYVFPTLDSPLQTDELAWYVVQALVALNPWLALAALIGCVLALAAARNHGARLTACMLIYVTIIYGIFQSEPRYAVPFRGAEIAMAALAGARLVKISTRLYRARAGTRPDFSDSDHKTDAPAS